MVTRLKWKPWRWTESSSKALPAPTEPSLKQSRSNSLVSQCAGRRTHTERRADRGRKKVHRTLLGTFQMEPQEAQQLFFVPGVRDLLRPG